MFRFISKRMKIALFLLCVFFLISLLLLNQKLFRNNPLDGPFPYEFKYEKTLVGRNFLFDLDNDGKEEFVALGIDDKEFYQSYLHLRNSDYVLRHQENLGGKTRKIFSLNWDENAGHEILAPYCRNDSLFLRILDLNAKTLIKEKFLFAGKTLRDETGDFEWHGDISQIVAADLDSDEIEEIIFFVNESFAEKPRGVFVFNKNFDLLWKHEIGPLIADYPVVYDFNNDGFLEIILPTSRAFPN